MPGSDPKPTKMNRRPSPKPSWGQVWPHNLFPSPFSTARAAAAIDLDVTLCIESCQGFRAGES